MSYCNCVAAVDIVDTTHPFLLQRKTVSENVFYEVSATKLALQYLVGLNETLGDKWMTPEYFRLGASTLANDLLMQLVKESTGRYQNEDYFSKD